MSFSLKRAIPSRTIRGQSSMFKGAAFPFMYFRRIPTLPDSIPTSAVAYLFPRRLRLDFATRTGASWGKSRPSIVTGAREAWDRWIHLTPGYPAIDSKRSTIARRLGINLSFDP